MGWARPNPTIWVRPNKVDWVNYNPTNLASLSLSLSLFFFFTLGGLDSTQPSRLGWKGSSPTHVNDIFPFACKKYSTCKWL